VISQMDLARYLEEPSRFKGLFCWNINIAASSPEQGRLRRALQREDLFTVVVDLFQTDTADFADLVLPASSFLEHDDMVVSYFHHSLRAQVKALEPPGEALSNSEIFRRLARAMGYPEPQLYEADDEILARLLEQSGTGLTFSELASDGTHFLSVEPRLQFADLNFPTASGHVEIASEEAERDGFPRVAQPDFDKPPAAGKFRLLSPATEWTLNNSYGNDPIIRTRLGATRVTLNPFEASELGLSEGQLVRIRSDTGELVLPLALSDDVPCTVALLPKGRWPKLEQSGCNVNVLNPGRKADMGESSSVHGVEVTVQQVGAPVGLDVARDKDQ